MAFEDFDLVTDRRKAAQKTQRKKKILIGAVVSTLLLACIVGAATFAVVKRIGTDNGNVKETTTTPKPQQSNTPHVDQYSRLVKMMCSNAEYKNKCESTLTEALKKDPKLTEPKDVLKVSMILAENEVNKAFKQTENMKFTNEQEKSAYDDCKQLFADAKEEMRLSITEVGQNDMSKLSSKAPELNNWLSAVISYQETCIDGFPEGEFKKKLEKTFKESRELLSNSLAVVAEVNKIATIFQGGVSGFKLPWGKTAKPAPPPIVSRGGRAGVRARAPAGSPGAAPEGSPGAAPTEGPDPFGALDGAPVEGPAEGPDADLADDLAPAPAWATQVLELQGINEKPSPNVVVAKDGSGDFKTISAALAAVPAKYEGRYVVYVKEGVYDETVIVTKKMPNLTMYGDGGTKSIITGNKNFKDGVRTFQTASFVVLGAGFIGRDMGYRNTAGAIKEQAVAARVQADCAIFINCNFEGYQDTLYAQTHRQFYRDCVISGTIDFIFGDASAVFQNCDIVVRKPLENQKNIITAQGKFDKSEETGFVLQKCVIKGDTDLSTTTKNYLGRPWKAYAKIIIMESEIQSLIQPEGWLPWEGEKYENTCYYGEYNNNGPAAATNNRVKWSTRVDINRDEASKYSVENFIQGTWINGTGVPANLGLYT